MPTSATTSARVMVLAVGALGAMLGPARAAAQAATAPPVTVAIYAPNAPFESSDARYIYVQRLAAHIGSVAGVPTRGVAFARLGDFEAAVKKRSIDFAVLDSVYLAAHGGFKVVAVAAISGRTAQPWGLFVGAGINNVLGLQGKRLTYANSGPKDLIFIEHALFDSEINLGTFFGSRKGVPDVASAVAAVALGKADAVFAPIDRGKGLRKIFEAAPVPNPAFVQVKIEVSPGVVAAVAKAVLGFGTGGTFDGWRSIGDPYRALVGRMGARTGKAAMSEPEVVRIEGLDLLQVGKIETNLPPLQQYYWVP